MDPQPSRKGKEPAVETSSSSSGDPPRLVGPLPVPRGGVTIRGPGTATTTDSRPIRAVPVSSRLPAEDAVPEEPARIASILTAEDLEAIRATFKIPDFVGLSVPGPEDRVTSVYSDRIALYEEYLRCGLRLPLHPFFLNILDRYRLAPNQLTPNSIRIVCAYVVLCHFEGVRPGLPLFRAFYQLRRVTGAWWSFAARPRRSWPLGLPSKVRGWKDRFFFAHVPGVRTDWREPEIGANSDASVRERDREMFNRLRSGQIPHYKELLSEHNLMEAELAPAGGEHETAFSRIALGLTVCA